MRKILINKNNGYSIKCVVKSTLCSCLISYIFEYILQSAICEFSNNYNKIYMCLNRNFYEQFVKFMIVFLLIIPIIITITIIFHKINVDNVYAYIFLIVLLILSPDIYIEFFETRDLSFGLQFGKCVAVVSGITTSCGYELIIKGVLYRILLGTLFAVVFSHAYKRCRRG